MAAYASLVSLMNVIHDLEHHHSPPISLDKQLIDPITQHVAYFQEFLQSYSSPTTVFDDDEEDVLDPLEMRIAAAAHAAEDAIESHIADTIQQQRANNASDENINSINLCGDRLQILIEEMDLTKVDTEKKKAPVVHDQVLSMTNVPASVARNETLVGSEGVLHEIMEKLVGGKLDCQVIPIVGMGGIGKTFLAKNVYARRLIKESFVICAWATISQQCNTGEILCELLSQATNMDKEELSGKSEDGLGLELSKHLFGRRFLIVMDDMWSIDAWDKIQRFLPNNENGSRVLVTTRLSQLSSQLNNNYSLPMSFLDEASSWELFSKTVFGDKSCPPELEKIGEEIVDNCRGLPLSIAVVGGLLKKMDGTRGSWESIRDNCTSKVNMENDKHCLRLLKLSYNHLPVYLKPCFLYMGVFEEDDEIRVSMLIQLWVSEGFLRPRNGEVSETTARGFLQDLIDRNLILIGKLGCTGSIKSCKIHDLVRDMCVKEGQKEGFYHVIGQRNPPPPRQIMHTQPRRVVINPRNTSKENACGDDLISMTHARSIICEHGEFPPCLNLGLLRTLHAYKDSSLSNEKSYLKFHEFCFVNLRYLSTAARGMSSFFPSVSLLWNLHTFIVLLLDESAPSLLSDFWKMRQFRHIEFINDCVFLPDPPGDGGDQGAVVMENLHTLKGVLNLKLCEGVVKRIPNIKKLKLDYDADEYLVGNIKYLSGLESLCVSIFSRRRGSNNLLAFPHSLKKLSLWIDYSFEVEDMLEEIGSLPLLEKLRLWRGSFGKGKWETVEGQFPCLKYLELESCSGLENWRAAEEGSNILPMLEHLRLVNLLELKNIPCELGNIDTLKSIELMRCGEGAVKSAKEMVDEQVDLQGGEDQLSFHVVVEVMGEMNKHLLSLAAPNFQVRL